MTSRAFFACALGHETIAAEFTGFGNDWPRNAPAALGDEQAEASTSTLRATLEQIF